MEAHGAARHPRGAFAARIERPFDAPASWLEEVAGCSAGVPNPDLHRPNGQEGPGRSRELRQPQRNRASELVRRVRHVFQDRPSAIRDLFRSRAEEKGSHEGNDRARNARIPWPIRARPQPDVRDDARIPGGAGKHMARIFKQVVAVRICNRLLLPTETLANVRAKMM